MLPAPAALTPPTVAEPRPPVQARSAKLRSPLRSGLDRWARPGSVGCARATVTGSGSAGRALPSGAGPGSLDARAQTPSSRGDAP